jgi:hypothetical protein
MLHPQSILDIVRDNLWDEWQVHGMKQSERMSQQRILGWHGFSDRRGVYNFTASLAVEPGPKVHSKFIRDCLVGPISLTLLVVCSSF